MSSSVLVACAVCLGNAGGPLLDAARLGVLVMAGVTCGVLALFARFFLRLRKGDRSLFQPPGKGDRSLFQPSGKGDRSLSQADGSV